MTGDQDSELIYGNSILDTILPSGMFMNGIVFNFQDTSNCSTTGIGKCDKNDASLKKCLYSQTRIVVLYDKTLKYCQNLKTDDFNPYRQIFGE